MNRGNDTSRHLLFGLLALQTGLIDQAALVAAFHAWTRDKARPLADHLIALGHLDPAHRSLLEGLAEAHVGRHGGDVEQSLGAIPAGRSTRESLAQIGDPELEGTLTHVGSGSAASRADGGTDRTASYSVGSATSDGQRFRVLRPHAQGGLGAVFVALDCELHREVALKQILDRHADDPVSRQRFLIEAEVTGGLEHPGIVPVYGLGTHDDGRPYYAMRFVRGDSLKDAIRHFHADTEGKKDLGRRSLELRRLLRRFLDVCNAIEYAHSRGILHRDIKPGNIIVGKHGETLVVDWGLAKATGKSGRDGEEWTLMPSSASGTAETLPGSALGTPAYMSPEQAEGDFARLGTQSDVYSLGATLYCLLTGRPPHQGDDIGELLRRVQRGEFPPPRQLDPTIDRALEAVCLKAMARELADRYASPKALSEDIERWMADEPVSALRESVPQRARRWARKHRTTVAAAACLLITSTIALAIGTVLITREWNETQAQRNEARVQAQQARQAVHLLTKVADSGFEEQLDPLQKEFLENALAYYEQFTSRVADDPGVRLEHGRAYQQMGDIQRKLGRLQESERSYRTALAMLEPFAGRPNAGREVKQALARTRTLLADLLVRRGADKGESEPLYNQAYEAQRTLADDAEATTLDRLRLAQTRKGQADLLRLNGQLKPARLAYDEAIAILEKAHADDVQHSETRNDLALAFDYRGWIHRELGELEQAEKDYRHALEVLEALVAEFPTVPRFREALAKACNSLGLIEQATGRLADAESHFLRELPLVERLAQDFPGRPEHQRELARTVMNLGNVLSDQRRVQSSEPYIRRAVDVCGAIAAKHPDDVQIRFDLAKAHTNLGELLRNRGDVKQAVDPYSKARAINESLVKASPDKPRYRESLAINLVDLALALETLGSPHVQETYRTALAIYEKLVADYPDNADYRIGQANCIQNFGPVLVSAQRPQEAEALYRKALVALEPKDGTTQTARWLRAKASLLNNLGELQKETGRPEAEKSLLAALSVFESLAGRTTATLEDRHYFAIAQNNVGDQLAKLDRPLEAVPFFARSAANFERLVAEAPNDIDLHSHFGIVLEGEGDLLLKTGKPVEARKAMESAVAQQRQALRLSKNRDSIRTLLGGHLIALARIDLTLGEVEASAACALEMPQIVPASERGQACLDAARILAQVIAQVETDIKRPEAERGRLTRNYLGRTIVLVGEAIDGSPKRRDEIKKDPHLKALESRTEFRTIMNALESAQR